VTENKLAVPVENNRQSPTIASSLSKNTFIALLSEGRKMFDLGEKDEEAKE